MKSWRTTIAGIIAAILMFTSQVSVLTDADPATTAPGITQEQQGAVDDVIKDIQTENPALYTQFRFWLATIGAGALAFWGFVSRDNVVTSEQANAR